MTWMSYANTPFRYGQTDYTNYCFPFHCFSICYPFIYQENEKRLVCDYSEKIMTFPFHLH